MFNFFETFEFLLSLFRSFSESWDLSRLLWIFLVLLRLLQTFFRTFLTCYKTFSHLKYFFAIILCICGIWFYYFFHFSIYFDYSFFRFFWNFHGSCSVILRIFWGISRIFFVFCFVSSLDTFCTFWYLPLFFFRCSGFFEAFKLFLVVFRCSSQNLWNLDLSNFFANFRNYFVNSPNFFPNFFPGLIDNFRGFSDFGFFVQFSMFFQTFRILLGLFRCVSDFFKILSVFRNCFMNFRDLRLILILFAIFPVYFLINGFSRFSKLFWKCFGSLRKFVRYFRDFWYFFLTSCNILGAFQYFSEYFMNFRNFFLKFFPRLFCNFHDCSRF